LISCLKIEALSRHISLSSPKKVCSYAIDQTLQYKIRFLTVPWRLTKFTLVQLLINVNTLHINKIFNKIKRSTGMQRIIVILFLLFHFNGLSYSFQEDSIDKAWGAKPLGAGSFGNVYLDLYHLSSSLVVIKELSYKLADSIKGQSDLDGMKKALERISPDICLNHELFGSPLITNILGVFLSKSGKVSYGMEPMLGGNLEQYLSYIEKNPTKLDLPWLRFSLARIALAIDYLHQKGWVWRDGSNKNIFIDFETGLAKISDFDLSQRISDYRNNNKPEDDWNDFGRRIFNQINLFLQDDSLNIKISPTDKIGLKEAQKLLSGPDDNTPGEITNFQDFKKLSLFKDINWQDIENNTAPSSFIPKGNISYLTSIYGEDYPDVLKLLDDPQQLQKFSLIEVAAMKGLTLSESFLETINNALFSVGIVKPINSAVDYCKLFYPNI
jgi:hypothetical protein